MKLNHLILFTAAVVNCSTIPVTENELNQNNALLLEKENLNQPISNLMEPSSNLVEQKQNEELNSTPGAPAFAAEPWGWRGGWRGGWGGGRWGGGRWGGGRWGGGWGGRWGGGWGGGWGGWGRPWGWRGGWRWGW